MLFLNVRLTTVCNVISIKNAEHANKDTDFLMMFVKNAQSKTAKAAEHPSVNVMLTLVSKASFTTPIKRDVSLAQQDAEVVKPLTSQIVSVVQTVTIQLLLTERQHARNVSPTALSVQVLQSAQFAPLDTLFLQTTQNAN